MEEVCCRPFLFGRSLLFVNCRLLLKVYCCRKLDPQFKTAIKQYKNAFSQFGVPKELIMDNGLELSSHTFRSFSKTWDILHKTISLHYHQLNGLAERFIQTVKH